MPIRTYQGTSDDDEVATDAVIVGIGSDGAALGKPFRATPINGIGRADEAILISPVAKNKKAAPKGGLFSCHFRG